LKYRPKRDKREAGGGSVMNRLDSSDTRLDTSLNRNIKALSLKKKETTKGEHFPKESTQVEPMNTNHSNYPSKSYKNSEA
jgi:hypothetical protein